MYFQARPEHRHEQSSASDGSSGKSYSTSYRKKVSGPLWVVLLLLGSVFATATASFGFCGFYVAKADTELFNRASKVVIARDGDRTVLTMANDFQGNPEDFAMVIPVPTLLRKDQIHVGDRAVIDHLDAYTAPRLVEYFDEDPCAVRILEMKRLSADSAAGGFRKAKARARQLGVTIEAQYSVGEYDILMLSAEQSDGLETWLSENGYKLPRGASRILGSYLKQGMRFFVAKVNLQQQAEQGFSYLRPLQLAFETPKFMLPIRLGTLNADGPQELFVWLLNRTGRVETTNYRTIRLPSDLNVPEFVGEELSDFYRDLFAHQVKKEGMKAVFLEYAWDMGWCDPCAADPLSARELKELGVFWQTNSTSGRRSRSASQNVFVTRLHLRYTADTFPEDLRFQETGDRSNFQGRYILQRPWKGELGSCPAAREYARELDQRREREAQVLATLTGREIEGIRRKAGLDVSAQSPAQPEDAGKSWWQKLWGNG